MLFNSFVFLIFFLPFTWSFFRLSERFSFRRISLLVLLLASLVFYSYWNPPFVFLLVFSICFNFGLSYLLNSPKGHIVLMLGVTVNLGLIGYFKYFDFFMSSVSVLSGNNWTPLGLFLPLGISFFTFQQIAYLVDCRKGKIKPGNFLDYALFVSFFPQLIAGPIVRYEEMVPQFRQNRQTGLGENLFLGLSLLAFGLFKKVVIADSLAPIVQMVYDGAGTPSFFDAFASTLAYTFQIYFDFSGYSDMALGLGALFGFRLPVNFNSPYKAASVIDFWRRWHITLSRFLRDYLYIPLGGNRHGSTRRYVNLMLTMLIGGLWHGAGWNFVLWGGLHGLYLVVNNFWRKVIPYSLPKAISWLLTFGSVSLAWILFRSNDLSRAKAVFGALIGKNGFVLSPHLIDLPQKNFQLLLGGLAIALILCLATPNSWEWLEEKNYATKLHAAALAGVSITVALWLMTYSARVTEFLYFQF